MSVTWDPANKGSNVTVVDGLRRIASGGSTATWAGTYFTGGGATVSSLLSDTYTSGINSTLAQMQFLDPGGNGYVEITFASGRDFVGFFMDLDLSGVGSFSGFHFTVQVWDTIGGAYATVYTGTSWTERSMLVDIYSIVHNATKIKVVFTVGASIGTPDQVKVGGFGPIESYGSQLGAKVIHGATQSVLATYGRSTGKYYFEVQQPFTQGVPAGPSVGIAKAIAAVNSMLGADANGWAIRGDGTKYHSAASTSGFTGYAPTDVIGIYADLDAGSVGYTINGVDKGLLFTGLSAGTYFPAAALDNNSTLGLTSFLNGHFDATDLAYSPPSGYAAWGTLPPTAAFSVDVASGPAPLIITFTDESTGTPTAWSWDFGDGDISSTQNPVHGFRDEGSYDVILTASNAGGSTTYSLTINVEAPTPSPTSDQRHPRIGYRCIGNDNETAVVTSDSTATDFAPENIFDWLPYTYWKPAATGEHYVQLVIDEAEPADYIAIAQHNLGESGGRFKLQYSQDAGMSWTDALDWYTPSGREQVWLDFDEISAAYWRVVVDATTAPVLGVVAFGLKYRPYHGQFSGFQPPGMARSFTLYASTSEAGLFLGRSILRKQIKGSIAFDLMTIPDAYGDWVPFMQAAEQHPFFLAWMIDDWPEDVQLVETSGDWQPPRMTQFGFIGTQVNFVGLLQE